MPELIVLSSCFYTTNHLITVQTCGIIEPMMTLIKEILQAAILATLFFGPLFYYFLFMMQP